MTSMTVLQAVPLVPLTKTISAKSIAGKTEYNIEQYDKAMWFSAKEHPISNMADLRGVLDKLIKDRHSCVIRGALKQGIDKNYFMRRKVSNPQGGAIEDIDQRWVCLDVDSIPLTAVNNSLQEAPSIIRSMLPTCFANAACWWNYSASQGFKGSATVSIHMWFWLNDDMSNAELKTYFEHFNKSVTDVYGIDKLVDTVLFDSIQIHYTAPPDLIGLADPLPARHGYLEGAPEVTVTEDWIRSDAISGRGATKYIEKIGDDKDGFHSPILSASAAWIRAYGFSELTNKEFKTIIRDTVDRADQHRHSKEQIERYKSDYFLDNLLKSAIVKGFDKPVQVPPDVATYFNNFIFLSAPARFYDIANKEFLSINGFDMAARHRLHCGGGSKIFIDAGGRIASIAMNLPGMQPLSVVKYDDKEVFNKWRGRSGVLLDDFVIAPWEDHMHFLCGHRDDITHLMLDYLAYIIANPGKKVKWAPILGSSVPGVGKSIIKIPLREIFREGLVEIGTEDVRSAHNSYMESELVVVEEVYGPDNRMMVNQIKAKITEHSVRINIKFVPQYSAPNFANFIMFTNHRIPFPIDEHDRRFMFVFSDLHPKKTEYYDQLGEWLGSHVNDVYSWARQRDLSKFNPQRAPIITAEKQEVMESSASYMARMIKEAMEDVSWPLQHDLIRIKEVVHFLNESKSTKFKTSDNAVINELKRHGARPYQTRITTKSGTKVTVWIVRNFEKYEAMGWEQIRDEMEGKIIGLERDYYSGGNM